MLLAPLPSPWIFSNDKAPKVLISKEGVGISPSLAIFVGRHPLQLLVGLKKTLIFLGVIVRFAIQVK